jgi:hypothetical protein
MERVKDFMGAAMRRLQDPGSPMAWLRGAWPTLAGKQLARRTEPLHFRNGRLEVRLLVPGEEVQLRGLEGDLVRHINKAWGRTLVREVHFSPARIRLPRAIDNSYTPFVRKGKTNPVLPKSAK